MKRIACRMQNWVAVNLIACVDQWLVSFEYGYAGCLRDYGTFTDIGKREAFYLRLNGKYFEHTSNSRWFFSRVREML